MSKLKQEGQFQVLVTIKHAASILNQRTAVIEGLVRRKSVVEAVGKRGRGGELRVDRYGLLYLDVAARLENAHVPRGSIRSILQKLEPQIDRDNDLVIVFSDGRSEIIETKDFDLGTMSSPSGRAITVSIVNPRRRLAEIERSLQEAKAPPKRGRPKVDPAWAREKLDSSAALGDDETSPDEIAAMLGDRGRPPWQREKAN